MTVTLNYYEFNGSDTSDSVQRLRTVTQPVENYSDTQIGNVTYRYVWVIAVDDDSMVHSWIASGDYWVDAESGSIVTVGEIY